MKTEVTERQIEGCKPCVGGGGIGGRGRHKSPTSINDWVINIGKQTPALCISGVNSCYASNCKCVH